MSTTRKRTATAIKQASNNIPIDYSYPQYGYVQPPVYNPEYMYPAPSYQNPEYMQPTPLYRNPEYIYPIPSYQNVEYVYYPVDQNGQILGPPTTFPPIVNPPHQESYPYSDRISNIPTRRSYIHSSRDRTLDEDYHHHHHHHHHHHRHSHHSHEKSKRETLPPINKHPFVSSRIALPDEDEYQQFIVRDLTERSSTSSNLSNRTTTQRIKYYDNLRKSDR